MVSRTRRLAGRAYTPAASGAVRALVLYRERKGGRKAANSTGLRSRAMMTHCSMRTRALLAVLMRCLSSLPAETSNRWIKDLMFTGKRPYIRKVDKQNGQETLHQQNEETDLEPKLYEPLKTEASEV